MSPIGRGGVTKIYELMFRERVNIKINLIRNIQEEGNIYKN
jgi:hypothetical protein